MAEYDLSLVIAIISLGLALLSLLVDARMAKYYHQEIDLLKKQYQDAQEEKQRMGLGISILDAKKYESVPDTPLKWVGVWMTINNRGDEQLLFRGVTIQLRFRKLPYSMKWLELKIDRYYEKKYGREYIFSLYSEGFTSNCLPMVSGIPEAFSLIDWDEKKLLKFDREGVLFLKERNEKKRWYLYGNFPQEAAETLKEEKLYLREIIITFYTDIGEYEVTKRFATIHSFSLGVPPEYSNPLSN